VSVWDVCTRIFAYICIHLYDSLKLKTRSYMRHDSFICAITPSYVRHDSFMCVTWLIHRCDMTHSDVWHDSFIYAPWLIHLCVATHSYVCHAGVTWAHSYVCNNAGVTCAHLTATMRLTATSRSWFKHMTHLYVWQDSFICVTGLIYMCDMTQLHVW